MDENKILPPSVNFKVLSTATLLAQREEIAPEYRSIVVDLLDIIAEYQHALDEVNKQKHTSSVTDFYNKNSELTFDDERGNLLSVANTIQKFLSDKHADLMGNIHKSQKDMDTLKAIIKQYIDKDNIRIIKEGGVELNSTSTFNLIVSEILQFSVLDEYMLGEPEREEDFVEEIRVDDFNDIRIVKAGREYRTETSFLSPEHAMLIAERLIRMSGQTVSFDQKNPFTRVRIGDTTRVSMMRSPIARRDSAFVRADVVQFCIRKQRKKPFTSEFLLGNGSIGEYGHLLLQLGMSHGMPMCFYGGTGTGKTAVLNAFMRFLTDRTITMAEIDEMNHRKVDLEKFIKDEVTGKLIKNPNYGKPHNSSLMWESPDLEVPIMPGKKGFTGMLNAALTFTPEAMVLQESKAGEIKDVIEAAISGHQVLTTVHADSVESFFTRILLMYQQSGANISDHLILKQVPQAFPWVVNLRRYKDGSRKVASITELISYNTVTGEFKTNTLTAFEPTGTKIIDGKPKLMGEHLTLKKPIYRSMERMIGMGLTETSAKILESTFVKTFKGSIPGWVDNPDYAGDN